MKVGYNLSYLSLLSTLAGADVNYESNNLWRALDFMVLPELIKAKDASKE